MRKMLIFLSLFIVPSVCRGGVWETKCSNCHGLIAPPKKELLQKFKTPEDLVARARALADKNIMPSFDFEAAAQELFNSAATVSVLTSLNSTKGVDLKPLPSLPPIPPDNSQTPVKIILGKMLFFETRLSKSNTISCNTCHNISSGGDDNQPVAVGYGWRKSLRNAPTIFNVGYLKVYGWTGKAKTLEEMIKMNIQDPVKMNSSENVADKLKTIPEYVALFRKAFPDEGDPVTFDNIAKAIAAYVRTLNTFGSPFDRFLNGDIKALSDDAKMGMNLFIEKGCISCHYGPMLTDNKFHVFKIDDDPGRYEVTGNDTDKNAFRTAPLRNVALTAPYFHNGSVRRLDVAVKVMADKMLDEKLTDVEAWRIKVFLESLTALPSIDSRVIPVLPQRDE
ncbi:cytochrome-c peroxidase [Desulfurobacterium sp.]